MDHSDTHAEDEAQVFQPHLNPLPRSIVRPNAFVLLDGTWRFALDMEDQGLRERWYLSHEYGETALWPGSIESHMAAAHDIQVHTPAWQDRVITWYEREFEVPEVWLNTPDAEVHVTFGACGYETMVWLNGHPLSTVDGEDVHMGEYTSFGYELRREFLLPVNRLTVRITDSMDAEIPRGKQESRVFQRGGIWYQTVSGPVRSIWLEPVERNRLRTRLEVESQIEAGVVEFTFTTRIHDPGAYTLTVVVAAYAGHEPLARVEFPLLLDRGDTRQRVALRVPNHQLWSPESPTLYSMVAQLGGPGGRVSQIESHFGLCKIEARDEAVHLNDRKLYLDGILYQPGSASYYEIRRHMLAIKRLGCNLVRVHIAGVDPRIYDLADEIGMLLWLEVPSPHSSTARSRANHRAELQRMLMLAVSHPSVVLWSLYNEDWGAQDIATNKETRDYIAQTYTEMRVQYPQFLVVDNDGWHHISVHGRLASNLLTAHLYTPHVQTWIELLDRLVAGHLDDVAAKPLVVGDPFFYGGQVPLLVSEWGGFGFTDYGGPEESAAKSERIRAFKVELRRRPIAGDVYTQAVSIEDEVNGLIDPHTAALQVPEGLLNSKDGPGTHGPAS